MTEGIRSRDRTARRLDLWIASAAGLLIVSAAGLLFRAPSAPPSPAEGARQAVGVMPPSGRESDPVAAEEAEFGDPTPLFMPTRWNSSKIPLPRREFTGSFSGFGPRFSFGTAALNLDLTPSIPIPAGPAEALEINPPANPSLGIGRADRAVPYSAARQARIEVVAEGSGRRVGRYDVPPGTIRALDGTEWHYLDLMAAANAAGLMSPMVPVPAPFDQGGNNFPPLQESARIALENYLTHRLLLGAHLTPGFYRISVGP
jgi:hypothetical protein